MTGLFADPPHGKALETQRRAGQPAGPARAGLQQQHGG